MKRTIEIIINPQGSITVDAVGFKGADCEKATRFIEEALGVVAVKQRKPEFHQRTVHQHQQRLGR